MISDIRKTKVFKVADHLFDVSVCNGFSDDFFTSILNNYEPFLTKECNGGLVFSLTVVVGESAPEYVEETRQDEEGQRIVCGFTAHGESAFDFYLLDEAVGTLICSKDYKSATLFILDAEQPFLLKYAVNNALMVLYAISTAPFNTALFHAAVIDYQNHGYLFLGKSGTGKSTHARLWLKYIEGSTLLNDDNPVVRFYDTAEGKYAKVYGSPWSGKTPCYKNEECFLGGFVLLAQAPYNEIERLHGVQAYAALLPCISGKRWESSIAEGLHRTENLLAANVPVWHLKCLPDEAAARLCFKHVHEQGMESHFEGANR